MSKLTRVVRFIFIIWMLAFALAMPQALQFGTIELRNGGISCTVRRFFFVFLMTKKKHFKFSTKLLTKIFRALSSKFL